MIRLISADPISPAITPSGREGGEGGELHQGTNLNTHAIGNAVRVPLSELYIKKRVITLILRRLR